MRYYCEKCKSLHKDDEICPHYKEQLKNHPEWLKGAADFVTVAGTERLVTTQALDSVAKQINKIAGTNLSYEGSQQIARDIEVFKRLDAEKFCRCGAFSTPENAKNYFENVLKASEDNPKILISYENQLTGYGQEIDWLRMKQGEISSIWEKSRLLDNNAVGVDGETVYRFTNSQISRTTVKASTGPMQNSSVINKVKESMEKGHVTGKDIIFGPEGTEEAARKVGLKNPVIEKNSIADVNASNDRLKEKVLNGQAVTSVSAEQVAKEFINGAVVGAAVAVTVSSVTTYIRYKNGEISKEEAYSLIGEDTLKGAIVGGAMKSIALFLPGGIIGFAGGVAIGIYLQKACTNLLDEVFGKGAFGAILNSSGYVYGMSVNLADAYAQIKRNNRSVQNSLARGRDMQNSIENKKNQFNKMKGF